LTNSKSLIAATEPVAAMMILYCLAGLIVLGMCMLFIINAEQIKFLYKLIYLMVKELKERA
jgi:hypothetical protein